MGKKSREKKIRREEDNLNGTSRKILKQIIRESSPTVFGINRKAQFFNPLKKLLEGEKYKTPEGQSVTQEMVKEYEKFLKQRFQQEKIAKANNIDMDKVDER